MATQVYDTSTWTGRKARKAYPRFELSILTPLFEVHVGRLFMADAYGIRLSLGMRKHPQPYEGIHVWSRTWFWWTAEQLVSA